VASRCEWDWLSQNMAWSTETNRTPSVLVQSKYLCEVYKHEIQDLSTYVLFLYQIMRIIIYLAANRDIVGSMPYSVHLRGSIIQPSKEPPCRTRRNWTSERQPWQGPGSWMGKPGTPIEIETKLTHILYQHVSYIEMLCRSSRVGGIITLAHGTWVAKRKRSFRNRGDE
jgi:hypothetical protein